MNQQRNHLTTRILGVAVATAALITPAIASAQDAPAYASFTSDQQIHGTVTAIDGTWNIAVADANGYTDNVALHPGTIINPTGLTLEPGMQVTIDGNADGAAFDAVEIDTPYQEVAPAPVVVIERPSFEPRFFVGAAVPRGNVRVSFAQPQQQRLAQPEAHTVARPVNAPRPRR